MRTLAAGKFKATCLALLNEVETKREAVLVTKNGKPIAKLVPLDLPEEQDPLDSFYFGKIEILGDVMAPLYSDEELEEFERASLAQLA